MSITTRLIDLSEAGRVPDPLIRAGIRRLLRDRLDSLPGEDREALIAYKARFLASMDASLLAVMPEAANEQHYEVPSAYYDLVLGPRRKYSSCHWGEGVETLEQAERQALAITCQRAGLADGQRILELGCGWGSLSLWMAEHYPGAEIVAVSNSHSQRSYIEARAADMGITNVRVITADMNQFQPDASFDRVVSVEMFEHMRNWRTLFARVASWLNTGGGFFMHVFCHRESPYFFVEESETDWMTRYFFRGGMMPSADLPLYFQEHLSLVEQWAWNGHHYAKTLDAWLARQDRQEDRVRAVMASIHGDEATLWVMRWRLFYMACAELFRTHGGNEWFVSHYLFEKKRPLGNRGASHD